MSITLISLTLPSGIKATPLQLTRHFKEARKLDTVIHMTNGVLKATYGIHAVRIRHFDDLTFCMDIEELPIIARQIIEHAISRYEELELEQNLRRATKTITEEIEMQKQHVSAKSIGNSMLSSIKVVTDTGIVIVKSNYTVDVNKDELIVSTDCTTYVSPNTGVACFGLSSPKQIASVCSKCSHYNNYDIENPFIIPAKQCSDNLGNYRLQCKA